MTVFLQNNGRPDLPPERRRPFPLPAARAAIAVGEKLAITADVLAAHGYEVSEESARNFATFVAGVYNGKRLPEWLSVIEEGEAPTPPPETETKPPKQGRSKPSTSDTAGDPGQGETE